MNKTVMTTIHPECAFRNQMSAMAWVMCGLCAWIILLSALAANTSYRCANYKTSYQHIEAPSAQ